MQLSQEVVLLRDAMMNAASGRGYFNVLNHMVLPSARLIECTVKDVVDLMKIDERTADDIEKALHNMHAMLFHKALQSAGNLRGPLKEHFEHVCTSVPYVSWPVYVQTVLLCNWHDLAREGWSSLEGCVFVEVATALAQNLEVLNDGASVKLWLHLLHSLIVLSFSSDHFVEEVICKMLHSVSSVELASAKAAVVFEQFEFFCGRLLGNVKQSLDSEASERILKTLLSESSSLCGSQHFLESTCPSHECIFTVKKLVREVEDANLLNLVTDLNDWLTKVEEMCAANDISASENAKLMESVANTNNADFSEESLNQLVENLRMEVDHDIISFLECHFRQLNQQHVSTLMEIKLSSYDLDIVMKIQQICFSAFAAWDLDVQDAYRSEYHTSFGLEVDPKTTASVQQELTDVANRLVSCGHRMETSTIHYLSRLCWMLPMETIKVLVEHAVKNRQISSVVKVLFHLRGSCASKVAPNGSALLIYTLKLFMLKKDLPVWNNFKALVEELLKCAVLDGVDLFKCLFDFPSLSCDKQLQMFQVILDNIEEECLCQLSKTGDLAVLLLLVIQILEEFELVFSRSSYSETTSVCDLVHIKQESLSTLRCVTALLNKHPELLSAADRAWLLKSSIKFHQTVRFRLRIALGNMDTSLTSDGFQKFAIGDLLLIASVSNATLHAVVKRLRDMFPATRHNSAIIQLAFVKILPRLTALELRTAMDAAIMYYQIDRHSNTTGTLGVVDTIRVVCESLVVLSRMGHLIALQELRIIEDLMATIKAIVEFHRLPDESLANVAFTLVRLSMDMINPKSSAVPKLLIVDLLRRRALVKEEANVNGIEQNCMMVAMIACLKDKALYEMVKRLSNTDLNVDNKGSN